MIHLMLTIMHRCEEFMHLKRECTSCILASMMHLHDSPDMPAVPDVHIYTPYDEIDAPVLDDMAILCNSLCYYFTWQYWQAHLCCS